MATGISDKLKERRNRVFLGQLPTDFLRLEASSQQQQEAADRQAALALHQQFAQPYMSNPVVGKLSITVAQAKLVKNYGMTRMDPYARIRVGHCVYETHTDPNGGKNPRWNKVLQHIILPQGVNSISVEIYDECSFTMDELIAWTVITIPKQVLAGETHEDWYLLNGKQGEGMEGTINLVLSYSTAPQPYYAVPPPVMMVPNMGSSRMAAPLTVYSAPPMVQPQIPVMPVLSDEELKQIEEMFPSIDKEVIKSVFEANRGNKDLTVNSLLQMCE